MSLREMLVYTGLLLAGCSGDSFTAEERAAIGKDPRAGVMRLYVVENRSDSLLLRRQAAPLSHKDVRSRYFEALKARMLATVTDPGNEGVGIAAPQVGVSRSLIAVQRLDKEGKPFEFYINPRIESCPGTFSPGREGCLSVPGRSGMVMRADSLVIVYNDPKTFAEMTEQVSGFTAVIFQHEIAHLQGKLFTDFIMEETKE